MTEVYKRSNYRDFRRWREPVYQAFKDRGMELNAHDLAVALGYENEWAMYGQFSEKDHSMCEKLAGPHGWAIYKMILARKPSS